MKKKIALFLCAALAVTALSGCAIQENIYKDDPELADRTLHPENYVEENENTGGGLAAATVHDFAAAFEMYDPDMVVATVCGNDVTWQEYYYWAMNSLMMMEMHLGEAITDYSTDFGGMSYNDYLRAMTELNCRQYHSVDYHAREMGVELSEESLQAIEEQLQSDIQNYSDDGTEEGFNRYLSSIYTSREVYDFMNSVAMLYADSFDHLYGANGEKLPAEDVISFGENNSFMVARHILIRTVDDSRQPLSDEEVAAARELAYELSGRINAGEDFDTLLAEYGEDPGQAYYPDGYCFQPGQMVTAFEDAVEALQPGEITAEPVESELGYHIIQRGELTPESVVEYQSESSVITLRYVCASQEFSALVNDWMEGAEVEYADGFEMDFEAVFGAAEIQESGAAAESDPAAGSGEAE